MPNQLILIAGIVGAIAVLIVGVLVMVAKFYRQVDQGKALIVNTMKSEPLVTFTGAVVYPIIHRAEVMDISVKTIEIDRRGKEGLICKDNIRADIKVTFFVRVNKTAGGRAQGRAVHRLRARERPAHPGELFNAKFSEALKTVGKRHELRGPLQGARAVQGRHHRGHRQGPERLRPRRRAIDYLEQTPIESLDKDNIMDAEGIRKITELTVIQNVKTNELRQKERMEMGSQNLGSPTRPSSASSSAAPRPRPSKARRSPSPSPASRTRPRASPTTSRSARCSRTRRTPRRRWSPPQPASAPSRRDEEQGARGRRRDERVEKARSSSRRGARARGEAQRSRRTRRSSAEEGDRRRGAHAHRRRQDRRRGGRAHQGRARARRRQPQPRGRLKIGAEAEAAQHLVKQVKAAEAAEEVAKPRRASG
jgi:uncharacterized membrane protein YqiK